MIDAILPLMLLMSAPAVATEPEPQPLVIGENYTLEALGTERQVNVVLPPSYGEDPDKKWPVVYMLDGAMTQDLMMGVGVMRWNSLWGRSQEVIWVGVETKDRQRELLPPTSDESEQERWPTAGSGAEFRAWITQKLTPLIEARYRHNLKAYLVGESAAGHFVTDTWLKAPQSFDGYVAISPSLQWDNQALSMSAIKSAETLRPPLYLSIADEGGATETGMNRLLEAMPEGQQFCFSDRKTDLVHGNSLHGLLPEGLQYLLPTEADWLEEFGFILRCDQGGPLPQ